MPNEIYHRSNWGESKAEDFGDVYYDHAATNKLYNHSDYYENSDGTDATLKDLNNKASIVLTPTAYSDGSLNTVIPPYQVLPTELVTNGTFDTDSDWSATNSTISISNGVCQVNPTATFGYLNSTSSFQTGIGKKYVYSFDCISRTGSGNVYMQIGTFQNGSNVTNQNVGEIEDNTSYSITFTATSTTSYLRIGFGGSGTSATIDNVSIKEVQEADFDFSRGSSATRVNEQGLVEDSQGDDYPRIDFTDGTGSLLLEPQRSNVITYSEDFSDSSWTINGATITSNSIISPNGALNATKLVENSSNSQHKIQETSNPITAGNVVYSQFLKKGERNKVLLELGGGGGGSAKFNLDLGVVISQSSVNATITRFSDNWYRCSVSFTSTSSSVYLGTYILDDTETLSYQGDGSSGVYIWGAQLEQGSYATSYIPTSGSTVTRSADVANNSGNADLFNDSEGVLYAEIAALADDGTGRRISISDNSSNPDNLVSISLSVYTDTIIGRVRSANTEVAFLTAASQTQTQNNKIAILYKQNDFRLFINGTQVATDTSGNTPTGLVDLSFDRGNGNNDFYGNVKCVAVFKEALSNDLLERLTGEGYESFRLLAEANNYTII